MFCPKCGSQNAENTWRCVSCGETMPQSQQPIMPRPQRSTEEIPNHLVLAILVTVLCCLPFGIVSIVYAASVDGKVAAGDIEGARRASDNAKLWAIIGAVPGFIIMAIYFLLMVIGVAAGSVQ